MKKDNIEEIYSKLEMFSKEPPQELWENIEAKLHPKKKRRGIFWFWGSNAAVLIVFIGYVLSNSIDNNESNVNVTNIEESKINEVVGDSNSKTLNIIKQNSVSDVNDSFNTEELENKTETLGPATNYNQLTGKNGLRNQKEQKSSHSDYIYERNKTNKTKEQVKNNSDYAQNSSEKLNNKHGVKLDSILIKEKLKLDSYPNKNGIVANDSIPKKEEGNSIELSKALLASNEIEKDTINIEVLKESKWSVEVSGGIASTSSQSYMQDMSVDATSQNDFIYALKFGYAISDRLVLKSGVGKNILGQEINNVMYASSDDSSFEVNAQSIVNNEGVSFLFTPESLNDFAAVGNPINEGTFQQRFDYIQLPLEFSYALLKDEKYSLSLGFGGNVNFLTDNKTYLDGNEIGESIGVNSTVFGATLNSNISYKIVEKMILFFEPSYNYFEKPVDNSNQSFNNRQLRVLFGLRYKL